MSVFLISKIIFSWKEGSGNQLINEGNVWRTILDTFACEVFEFRIISGGSHEISISQRRSLLETN